jgi:hypothetical protein
MRRHRVYLLFVLPTVGVKMLRLTFVRPPTCVAAIVLLACMWLGAQTTSPATMSSRPDTVAVGDVHGDFDDLVAILQRSGVIDAQHRWSARNLTLVQVGDQIDRGPKPREVMDYLMALQKEAPRVGGRVVPLLGNHEMMNIMGDLRYVTAENYATFTDSRSEQRRHSAYQQYAKWRKDQAELLAEIPKFFQEQTEAEWDSKHPAGYVEQREAFGPDGKYGKWLRGNSAITKIGDVIFLHGGISPSVASMKLEEINRRVHDEITAFDNTRNFLVTQGQILPFFTLDEMTAVVQAELAILNSPHAKQSRNATQTPALNPMQLQILQNFLAYQGWLSVASDGPLWFRGYDQWSEDANAENVENLLKAYGVKHIVVGHTPQKDGRIRSRFGGKILLIDTGMLSTYYPGGRASVLEVFGGTKFTAEYMDEKTVLLDQRADSRATAQPSR